jgi:hypothetical protein
VRIHKLLDDKGREIKKPAGVDGTVSFAASEGIVRAWDASGKILLEELRGARVVWMSAIGMRIEGFEPRGLNGERVVAMTWQVNF